MTLFPETVETDRLRLERLTESVDCFEFYEVCSSDPGIEAVTEYLPWSPHETVKETWEFLAHADEQWAAGEAAQYAVRPRDGEDGAGEIAGATGISVDWDTRSVELGCWFRRRFWGRGYSGERAAALLELAFERLDLELVEVTVVDGNEQSRRAVEKYVEAHGGRHEGLLRNARAGQDGEVVDLHRYTVSQAEYRG